MSVTIPYRYVRQAGAGVLVFVSVAMMVGYVRYVGPYSTTEIGEGVTISQEAASAMVETGVIVGFAVAFGSMGILIVRDLLKGRKAAETNESSEVNDIDWQQKALDNLEGVYSSELYYCRFCDQLYGSFGIFADHLTASDDPAVKAVNEDGAYVAKRVLDADDPIPDDATIGKLEPCPGGDLE